MLPGRFSESFVDPGSHGQVGNTLHALSYDAMSGLGSQWKLYLRVDRVSRRASSPTRRVSGTGEVTYRTEYTGGQFWMSKIGPWGDGTVDYTGTIDIFTVTTTYMFVNNQVLGIRSNVTTIGSFDNYDGCFEYTINNTAFYGDTDTVGSASGGFPRLHGRLLPARHAHPRRLGQRDGDRAPDSGKLHGADAGIDVGFGQGALRRVD